MCDLFAPPCKTVLGHIKRIFADDQEMIKSDPHRFGRKGNITEDDFLIYNSYRVATAWMGSFAKIFQLSIEMTYNLTLDHYVGSLDEQYAIMNKLRCQPFSDVIDKLGIPIYMD